MISLIVIVLKSLDEACVCRGDSGVEIKGCVQAGVVHYFFSYYNKVCQTEVFKRTLIPAKQLDLLITLHIFLRSLTLFLLQFHISYYWYFVIGSRISALSLTEVSLTHS